MAGPAEIPALSQSDRAVRIRPRLCVPVAAAPADGLAARWLAALDQHPGNQRGNCRDRGVADLADRRQGVLPGAPADPAALRDRRRVAVLRAAPVRGHLLERGPRLELPRSGVARLLVLRP